MPSPFPGMDPWLEDPDVFPDLHNRLIAHLSTLIASQLPAPYYSRIGNRVFREDPPVEREPDIHVHSPRDLAAGGVATIEFQTRPVVIQKTRDPVTEWTLDIRNGIGHRLVTSIEVLSPSNKRKGSRGRAAYLKKQREMQESRVNLVELDFLRDGHHSTAIAKSDLASHCGQDWDYHVCVTRIRPVERFEVYPILLTQVLPTINIPLDPEMADLQIALEKAMDACRTDGQYERQIDYDDDPKPPLSRRQRDRVQTFLKTH